VDGAPRLPTVYVRALPCACIGTATPEWQSQEPFKSALSNDPAALEKFTEKDWLEIVVATHSGMSTEAFRDMVGHGWKWRKTLG
jgi:hypothetical protein